MDKLGQITTLLKVNGINTVAKQLKIKKADIYKFLEENGLAYRDGEVKLSSDIKNDIASNNKLSESKDIDIESLKELVALKDDLKELIQQYNKSKNIIDVKHIELNPPNITEVKQKLFKVDIDVLNEWIEFVATHKQYKVQSLISLALKEFIQKYK